MELKPVPPIKPEHRQLLSPWHSQNGRDSRTLDFFDAIPKYPFSRTRVSDSFDPEIATFTIQGKKYKALIRPAAVDDKQSGRTIPVFPGAREELVERALRFLAVQELAPTRITPDLKRGTDAVTVFFTLSKIRQYLQEIGHGYNVTEIRAALDILSKTIIEIARADPEEHPEGAESPGRKRPKRTRFVTASIFTRYSGDYVEGDETGEASSGAVTFHPLATDAILEAAFYPINQLRVGKLKLPLSRWLTARMSHNYRQASKAGLLHGEGYHIALSTILNERGLEPQPRLRDNLLDVRRALKEMSKEGILRGLKDIPSGPPYDEKLTRVKTKRRPAVTEAVWTLYASAAFIEEIVRGNVEMAKVRLEMPNKGA